MIHYPDIVEQYGGPFLKNWKIEFGISITYVGRSPEKDLFTENFLIAIRAPDLSANGRQ